MNTLLLTTAAIAGLALLWWVLRRPGATRGGTLAGFLRELEARGVAPELASAAYAELSRWLEAPRTPACADPLERVYGIAPGEEREAAILLARACGRSAPVGRPPGELATAADLVVWVAGGSEG